MNNNSFMTRQQYRQIKNRRRPIFGQSPKGFNDMGLKTGSSFKEFKIKRLSKRLNKIIAIVIALIIIVYLILIFVNF